MSKSHLIRKAELADLEALTRLEQSRFASDRISSRSFRRWLARGHEGLAVAMRDERLLGYVLLLRRRNSEVARLYSIAVAPEVAGQGLGAKLLEWAEDLAYRWGMDRIRLEVAPQNKAARDLYERHGYWVMEQLPGYYQNGDDALRLEKSLDNYWQA